MMPAAMPIIAGMENDSEDAVPDLQAWLPPTGGCKFILDNGPWDKKPPEWCPNRAMPGSVYCEEHYDRCYQG